MNNLDSLPAIPDTVITRDGQEVDTSSLTWEVQQYKDGGNNRVLNFKALHDISFEDNPILSEKALHIAKLFCVNTLRRYSPTTSHSYFRAIYYFTKWLSNEERINPANKTVFNWSQLDEDLMRDYANWCEEIYGVNERISGLRTFYRWGVSQGYSDFSRHQAAAINSISLKTHHKGANVRFNHPTKGPLTKEEVALINRALRQDQGRPTNRAIVMLFHELGIRPIAASRLTNRDLKRIERGNQIIYQIDVPRAKQKTQIREVKRRPISSKLGLLLESLMEGEPDRPLLHWLGNRNPSSTILEGVTKWTREVNIISPRTGLPLQLHPRRFRYTIATEMANEGASRTIIAEILDHSDLRNVAVYVETRSTISEYIEQSTNELLEPIIKYFLGEISSNYQEQAGNLPQVPAISTQINLINANAIGGCSANELCALAPPLSCYICPSFKAKPDGPHQQVFEAMLSFIKQHAGTADDRILMQLDEVINAVKELICSLNTTNEEHYHDNQ
ncbi:MAG: site-specific integrase [Chloroflexota bacterium]